MPRKRSGSIVSNAKRHSIARADPQTPAGRPRLSKRRRRIFILISLLFPVLALFGLEGVLRLSGFGGFPPTIREIASTDEGTLCITDRPGPASYFDANKSRPGSNEQYAFFAPKPKGTVRIVTAGGSAMKGFPQPTAFASSAFLQAMLSDVWPDRRVEVINMGTTAVASFPVLGMLREAVEYQPDLVVVFSGHNEFYGAYGVASLHSGGLSPTAIRFNRWTRSLGILQCLDGFRPKSDATKDRKLMEAVIGESFIRHNDPIRQAAARNLAAHIGEMIDLCRGRGIPIIVCTLPSNERDLAPLGADDTSHLPPSTQQRIAAIIKTATSGGASGAVVEALKEVLVLHPDHARAHYLLGRTLFAQGHHKQAASEFQTAIDLDPMPWRAPGPSNDAIRQAAQTHEAILCDVRGAFRAASLGGCIGWELMDDHVHPSLHGQALLARAIVQRLTTLKGSVAVSKTAFDALPSWEQYAKRLGDNKYDRYGVAHTLRVLGNIPFYKKSNPGAYERFHSRAIAFESSVDPDVREVAFKWQKPATHKGAKRPMSGMVGRVMVRQKRFAEGERLFRTAERCVAEYSGWNLEFTYFRLACRLKQNGSLNDKDRQAAAVAIERGRLLMKFSPNPSGDTRRYVGRLHQLRDEYEESIPYLKQARLLLYEMDRVATDVALVEAYLKTGDLTSAEKLAREGILKSGQYASYYQQLLAAVAQRRKKSDPPQEATP